MATRTAYAGTALSGDIYTAQNHARMPGGWLGYAEFTGSQNISSSEVDVTSLTLTVSVNDSRRIRITTSLSCDNGNNFLSWVNEDGSHVGIRPSSTTTAAHSVVRTPAGGPHTYKVTAQRGGAADANLAGSASAPLFILVEDIGPA